MEIYLSYVYVLFTFFCVGIKTNIFAFIINHNSFYHAFFQEYFYSLLIMKIYLYYVNVLFTFSWSVIKTNVYAFLFDRNSIYHPFQIYLYISLINNIFTPHIRFVYYLNIAIELNILNANIHSDLTYN